MDIRGLIDDPSRIQLVAQPIVDLQRGIVTGYEVLSRFQLEPRTSPDRVFAEANRQGLGPELEATVVARALELALHKPPNCFLTFNVDPGHLSTPELGRVLADRELSGVVVELTEHRVIEDLAPLVRQLSALRERGAMIAVDDAGSGYSGLRQLLELRPQLVKLDRDLVTNVHEDAAKYALIQMLGELAGRLDSASSTCRYRKCRGSSTRPITQTTRSRFARRAAELRPQLFSDLADDATRVARGKDAFGHIARDHAARTDDGARADSHAGQNDGAPSDPDVGADQHWLSEFFAPA